MKKLFALCLALSALFALSSPALAAEWNDYRYWDEENQCWVVDVFAYSAAKAAEEAALAAMEQDASVAEAAPEPDGPIPEDDPEPPPLESAGVNNGASETVPVDNGISDKYPVGSYVDAAGDVWAPDGTRLSPPPVQALPPAGADTAATSVPDASESVPPETGAPVYSIVDLRADTDTSGAALSGLKALMASIFGEYTPVTTTSVITETVGEHVNQYLVETVAPGAAGVDYEWLAGVFLFGILLFCLMKLLGGVLK